MKPPSDNDAFWRSGGLYVAANPHQKDGANGLAEFAATRDDLRSLLFFQTSGSETEPKWVGLSREAFLAAARAANAHLEATSRDRWLIALPLHHVGGFAILARCHANGAHFVHWRESWDAARFASACAGGEISLTSLVPAQVFDLVGAGIEAPGSLRAVVVGGGSLHRDLGVRAHELGWRVLQSYGMTETASQVATEPLDHLGHGFDPERLEVLAGLNLRCDSDGRLIVRGDAVASGYAIREENGWRWEPVDHEAGLRTRDRVELSMHGVRRFLRFIGRDAEFVKVLGELVNVAALQRRLDETAVAAGLPPGDAVIWPVPDERMETQLVLVGAFPLARLEELRGRFNASAQGIERLAGARPVARLPRTALGKIDRAAMSEAVGP